MNGTERQPMLDKSTPTETTASSALTVQMAATAALSGFHRSGGDVDSGSSSIPVGNRKVVVEMLYLDDECYDVESEDDSYGSGCCLNGAAAPSNGGGSCGPDDEGSPAITAKSTPKMNGGFRLLRAYRRRRKQKSSATILVIASPSVPEAALQQTITIDDGGDDRLADTGSGAEQLPIGESEKPYPEWKKKLAIFAQRCAFYGKKLAAFLLSTVGLAVSMVAYAILGGFLFSALEAPHEVQVKSGMTDSLRWHVEALWNETQKFNVLHPVDWTRMAERVMHNYTTEVYLATTRDGFDGNLRLDSNALADDVYTDIKWSFAGALLFSITVITTIGYGHIAPKTPTGRLMTILYATIGIPLTLLALAHIGGFLATVFRFIYKNILCDILLPLLHHSVRLVARLCRRGAARLVGRSNGDDEPEVVDRRRSSTASGRDVATKDALEPYDEIPEVVVIAGGTSRTPSCVSDDSDKQRSIPTDHSDVTIADRHRTGNDSAVNENDGLSLSGAAATKTGEIEGQTTSAAIRKRIRKRKEAALKGVQQTYDMFFEWRRGVARALYNDDNQQVRVPVHVSLLLISGYIILGSMMFGLWESDWNLLIGSYFCFITLSTIGFGDFVPGTSLDSSAETAKLVLCSMYLVIGMAMLAMCFELMQEEARQAFRSLGRMLGLIDDDQPQQQQQQQLGVESTSEDPTEEEKEEGSADNSPEKT